MFRDVRLLSEAFEPEREVALLSSATPDAGGVANFIGKVRAGQNVEALELTHYEPLTLPGMEELADQCLDRWSLEGLLMVHRIGMLQPGEPIVCVAAAARHRRDAIEAVDFAMDHLKSRAWFWKREKRVDRSSSEWDWIEPREQDYADLTRWD